MREGQGKGKDQPTRKLTKWFAKRPALNPSKSSAADAGATAGATDLTSSSSASAAVPQSHVDEKKVILHTGRSWLRTLRYLSALNNAPSPLSTHKIRIL